jgi:hypothetical protein
MGETARSRREPWRWIVAGFGVLLGALIFGVGAYFRSAHRSVIGAVLSTVLWVVISGLVGWWAWRKGLIPRRSGVAHSDGDKS